MSQLNRNAQKSSRFPRYAAPHLVRKLVLPLTALLLLSPLGEGARPGGVAVLLPPFVPTPAPQNFLPGVSPFAIIGFIQSATLDSTCTSHPFCGGTLVVNNTTITVPTNTIFQMPATAMTWEEMFINAPSPYGPTQSGLALSDSPKPLTTYEINVSGNRVIANGTDRYIAGLIYISNQSVNSGQGFINFIDYAKSEIWVSQTLTAGPAGARIRLNTPNKRYGNPDLNADRRFAADEDNPTIAARTGYPMCIPRTDPKSATDSLCPYWNRPVDPYTGAFSTNFTMAQALPGVPDANGITHQSGSPTKPTDPPPPVTPDPFEQVPFEIGDFLTYAGTLTADPSGGLYISAHTVAADIGVFTAPNTWPVYVSMGEFRIGVGGTPNPIFPQEAVEKVFGDFFTTDSASLVDIYAVDVDPCLGTRTHRYYGTSDPFGPPLGGLKGRARFRTTIGNFLPATREMAVSSRALTGNGPLDALPALQLTANGLAAGVFQAPQFQYIFPENLVMGSPQIPLTFQEFPFLVNGFGPYVPFNAPAGTSPVGVVGQLSPWPSITAPPSGCTTGLTLLQPPVSNAGAPQTVVSDNPSVALDGSLSADTNTPALPLIFTWAQSSGPAVIMIDGSQKVAHFKAPHVASGSPNVVLGFQLAVCNGYTCGGVSSVNVTVTPAVVAPPPPAPLSAVTLTAAPGSGVHQGSAVALTAAPTGGTLPMTYTFTQTAGPAQTLPAPGTQPTATFAVNLPTPVTATTLSFNVSVKDSAVPPVTRTATVNVSVSGPDTITATNTTYVLSKSRLQVSANTDALPKGSAVLTITPIGTSVPISAATNANPVVLTSNSHGFALGSSPTVTIIGATANWSRLNGTFVVTVIDANHFSVPVNTKVAGALFTGPTGSLSFTQSFGPDVVCTYDPTLDTYNVLASIVNPGPDSVRIRSSYGGSIVAPITKTR